LDDYANKVKVKTNATLMVGRALKGKVPEDESGFEIK
jgi:hypothetical protein